MSLGRCRFTVTDLSFTVVKTRIPQFEVDQTRIFFDAHLGGELRVVRFDESDAHGVQIVVDVLQVLKHVFKTRGQLEIYTW